MTVDNLLPLGSQRCEKLSQCLKLLQLILAPAIPAASHHAPCNLPGASLRYLNQSRAASAIECSSHNGASRHSSMYWSMIRTPSSKRTFGCQPSICESFVMSANVQSGSPGRFGTWTTSPPSRLTRRLTLYVLPDPTLKTSPSRSDAATRTKASTTSVTNVKSLV